MQSLRTQPGRGLIAATLSTSLLASGCFGGAAPQGTAATPSTPRVAAPTSAPPTAPTSAPATAPTAAPRPQLTTSAPTAPAPAASASSRVEGWPVFIRLVWDGPPVVAKDGTAYAWIAGEGDVPRLASFDASGRLRQGWPVDLAPAFSAATLKVLSDGTVLASVVEEMAGEDVGVLHRLRPDGRELPGWPVRIHGASTLDPPVEGPDGTVWLAWLQPDAPRSLIASFDVAGRMRRGWPVTISRGYVVHGEMRIARDGTVYALGAPTAEGGRARLWAFSSDGRTLPGWPITLRSANAWFDVLSDGRVLHVTWLPIPSQGLCGAARATIFAVVDRRGRTARGWPLTAKGYASTPRVGADGTIHYAAGDRLVARTPDGRLRPGWPVAIPPIYAECGGGVPILSPDGSVHVIAGEGILAFTPAGHPKTGWPFVPDAGFTGHPCVADAPGVPAPAFGPDGTLYVPTWADAQDADGLGRTGITAVDTGGRVVRGWPFAAAARTSGATGATALTVAGGHLYATLVADCSDTARLVALEPDGSVVR